MEDCSRDYAISLLDPYGSIPCCLPTFPALPSQKLKGWVRGTVMVGQASAGFVLAQPLCVNNLTSGSGTAVVYTNSSYPFGRTPTLAELYAPTLMGGLTAANFNSPFTVTNFDVNNVGAVEWRPVSLGIRVRYSGTELNRGGTIFLIEEPDHQEFIAEDTTTISKFKNCLRVPVTRSWATVNWIPKRSTELEYTGQMYYSGPSGGVSKYGLLILFTGTPGNTFDFEVCMNYEAIGYSVPSRTPSFSNETSTKSIISQINSGPVQGIIQGRIQEYLGAASDRIVDYAIGTARKGLLSLMM